MNPEKNEMEIKYEAVGRPFYTTEADKPVLAQRYNEITTFPQIISVCQIGPDQVVERPQQRVKSVIKIIESEE